MKIWKCIGPLLWIGAVIMCEAPCAAKASVLHVTVGTLPHDTMSKKVRAFKKKWNKKIDQLDVAINRDQKKLSTASDSTKNRLSDEIRDMKVKRDELKKEVDGAGSKTAAQWDEFKGKVSDQYDALSDKVKNFFNSKW